MMNMMNVKETLSYWASVMTTIVFVRTFLMSNMPSPVRYYAGKLKNYFKNSVKITFDEFIGSSFYDRCRSEAYSAIDAYLGAKCGDAAMRLRAEPTKANKQITLHLDDYETIEDKFKAKEGEEIINVRWFLNKEIQTGNTFSRQTSKKSYQLTFHRKHRKIIRDFYISYVFEEGKKILAKNEFQKIYSNSGNVDEDEPWTSVPFDHSATFKTLAMDPVKKQEIIDDLEAFAQGKEYYKKIGKPWKRGYLLYGPPGTGKSTMIAAMANLLDYNIYDLELTAVKSNTHLRKLLIETDSKSIIVVEDIDCSLDLTGKRAEKNKEDDSIEQEDQESSNKESSGPDPRQKSKDKYKKKSDVTLSGLLNMVDGLWSTCSEERIIAFTSNHIDKLDPALIRRGRMDMHIELSYCQFEAFKVLARNYLGLESHHLFEKIRVLLEEVDMIPADVAENLMPKRPGLLGGADVEIGLERLIGALERAKEDVRLKAPQQNETNQSLDAGKESVLKTGVGNGDNDQEEEQELDEKRPKSSSDDDEDGSDSSSGTSSSDDD